MPPRRIRRGLIDQDTCPDFMQIVRQYSQPNVAFVASKTFVRTTIQPMVLQTVDIALYCAMGILALASDQRSFALQGSDWMPINKDFRLFSLRHYIRVGGLNRLI